MSVYFGGLLSLGQVFGALFWSGIFFLLLGIAWLVSHRVPRVASQSTSSQAVSPPPDKAEVYRSDEDFKKALNTVLAYYGTQLQSHAATLLGFTVAIIATLSLKPTNFLAKSSLSLVISLLLTLAGYIMLRLIVYGGLSGSILYCSFDRLPEYAKRRPDFNWATSLPQTCVSFYAHTAFDDQWRPHLHLRLFRGSWFLRADHNPRHSIIIAIWAISLVVAGLFVFLA